MALALVLLLGLAQPATAATVAPYANADFMRGMNYVSPNFEDFGSADSDHVLSDFLQPLGANWVALVVTCYQLMATSTDIFCLPFDNRDNTNPWYRTTPPDSDVVHAVATAHSLGMKVMLKPHIELLEDPSFRGDIGFGQDERPWDHWFASYRGFISKYALLARDTGAESLAVGTELVNANRDSKCHPNAANRGKEWRAIVAAVRQANGGKLDYPANYGLDDCGEDVSLHWWDALNSTGIDAYYPLARDTVVTVQQLVVSWQRWADRMTGIAQRYNKHVILTEIGYQSRLGTHNMRAGNVVLDI